MYYFDKQFPPRICTEILRVKRNESSVDLAASNLGGGEIEFTPTNSSLRQNEASEEAEEAANMAHAAAQESGGGEEDEVDMDDALYVSLELDLRQQITIGPIITMKAKPKHLRLMQRRTTRNALLLFLNTVTMNPSNCLTLTTTILEKPSQKSKNFSCTIIYTQYVLKKYRENQASGEPSELPPMQSVYIEGLPGVGKTHCILTIQNMTRVSTILTQQTCLLLLLDVLLH